MLLNADLESWIKQLGQELEIPGELKTGEINKYKLLFGNTLQVSITMASEQEILLSGAIGPLPSAKKEEFLAYLAFGNLFGEGTGDGVIFLDNEGKLLYLSRRIPRALNYARFKEEIEMFVNYLEMWQKKRMDADSGKASYQNGILQPLT
jgi:hypothetical protein